MTIDEHIDIVAERHGLDADLVRAVVEAESNGNPAAMRYEPTWPYFVEPTPRGVSRETEEVQQKTSWGLMQVMGTVAREMGCDAPFLSVLCQPAVGLEYGCRYLAKQVERYDGSLVKAVSAYNLGTARTRSNGDFVNQSYVTKVWSAYMARKGGL